MASNTILTTSCINLSLKVGTPRGLFLPFFFGMYTLFDGWGWYVSSFNISINFSIRFRLMLSMV